MDRLRALLKRLMHPPRALLLLLMMVSAAGLAWVFSAGENDGAAAYVFYLLSAWTLAALVVFCAERLPRLKRGIRQNELYRKYEDPERRAGLTLRFSLISNAAYALFKGAMGVSLHSWWFGTVAIYYLLLSIGRAQLLLALKWEVNEAQAWCIHGLCGALLLLVTLAVASISVLVIRTDSGPRYPGMLIYASAAYAFFAIAMAVRNVLRFRRLRSPLLLAAKSLSLVTAIVSIYFLQTAMLRQFGGTPAFEDRMNALSGGAAVLLISMISAAMMRAGRKNRRNQEK